MRKFVVFTLFALLLGAQIVAARSWLVAPQETIQTTSPQIIPHFAVFPGQGINLTLTMSFNAGLVGIPDSGIGAEVYLYLYDGVTGEVLKSGTGLDVCNPCVNNLSTSTRKISLSVEQKFEARGGFSNNQIENGIIGFGILVISGDQDAVALQAVQKYTRASTRIPLTQHISGPLMFAHFSDTPEENTDTTIHFTYVGGLARLPAEESIEINLYLYDDTGELLQGNNGSDVCGPCILSLTSSERKQSIEIGNMIAAHGGFATPNATGFGIIVVGGGTNENLGIQVVQEFPFGINYLPLTIR